MTQYARITERDAPLAGDFGNKMARRIFGDAFIDSLPTYVKGRNKGKAKGVIAWGKVVEGGWISYGPGGIGGGANGRVENRVNQVIWAKIREDNYTGPNKTLKVWEKARPETVKALEQNDKLAEIKKVFDEASERETLSLAQAGAARRAAVQAANPGADIDIIIMQMDRIEHSDEFLAADRRYAYEKKRILSDDALPEKTDAELLAEHMAWVADRYASGKSI